MSMKHWQFHGKAKKKQQQKTERQTGPTYTSYKTDSKDWSTRTPPKTEMNQEAPEGFTIGCYYPRTMPYINFRYSNWCQIVEVHVMII